MRPQAGVRCAGCAGCGASGEPGAIPSPALARALTGLAALLFAGPLLALLLLATLLEDAGPGATAAVIGLAAWAWVLTLQRVRPRIDRCLETHGSELPRPLLVRERTDAAAASRIESIRSQS